jgi:hypothetical protein
MKSPLRGGGLRGGRWDPVGCGAGTDGKDRAFSQGNTCEADDGRVERGEVAAKSGADAAGMVRAECGYRTDDDGFGREDKRVVRVDRVDELGADRLADAHREMIIDLDRKRCSYGQANDGF